MLYSLNYFYFFKLQVFVLVSYYQLLRQTMTVFFPQGISQVAEALVSISRLQVCAFTVF